MWWKLFLVFPLIILHVQEHELIKKLSSSDAQVRDSASAELVKLERDINGLLLDEIKKTENEEIKIRIMGVLSERYKKQLSSIQCEQKEEFLNLVTSWFPQDLYTFASHVKKYKFSEDDLVKVFRFALKREIITSDVKRLIVYNAPVAMIDDIAPFLKEKSSSVKCVTVTRLADLKAKKYGKEIAELLFELDEDVRLSAIYAIGALELAEYKGVVAKLLLDPSNRIVHKALWTLVVLGATEYSKNVASLLLHSEHSLRSFAANALAKWNKKEFATDISQLLKDPVYTVRGTAAMSLGRLGAKEFSDAVIKLLDDPEPYVRRMACSSLAMMNGKDSTKTISKLLSDKDEQVRLETAITIAGFGDKSCIDTIFEFALNDRGIYTSDALYAVNKLYNSIASDRVKELSIKGKANENVLGKVCKWLEESCKIAFEIEKDMEGFVLKGFLDRDFDTTLEKMLKQVAYSSVHNISFIFTDEKIRVVSVKTAREFFKEWVEKNR